jgi:serine/threonine protein kinase
MATIPENTPWKATGRTYGQGGQGTVVEVVRQGETGPKYAMKILKNGESSQAYARFSREIDALSKLNSLHIARVVARSEPSDNFHYYVMESYDGARSLDSIITKPNNPFHGSAGMSITLFEQLMFALRDCIKEGVIHRDLSPANVLLLPDFTIRIIDFGICQFDGDSTVTLTDENLGTRNYAAPECESGSTIPITMRSDLYSAGKILWSAITNRRAFAREAPAFGQLAINKLLPNELPTWHLQRLLARTIRRNPGDRYESPDAAIEDLTRIRLMVASKRFPLEHVANACPVCGYGALKRMEQGHAFFANPQPPEYQYLQCTECGHSSAVNMQVLNEAVQRLYPTNEV